MLALAFVRKREMLTPEVNLAFIVCSASPLSLNALIHGFDFYQTMPAHIWESKCFSSSSSIFQVFFQVFFSSIFQVFFYQTMLANIWESKCFSSSSSIVKQEEE